MSTTNNERGEGNEGNMTDKPTFNNQPITRIQVIGYEWFDKINGNSYCSARVYVNDELVEYVPFQLGYGSAYLQYAAEVLNETKIVTMEPNPFGGLEMLWRYCADHDIELLRGITKQLKRDVKAWGERDNNGSKQ